ncbi:glycosyltransferase family 1 protein [Crocosphaera sp.]|uniref:glycosyltransferase family 1 protein n=1 Tax=Crocosphaera sp. TaxID=2729996 RepID=UPI003F1F3AF2|nr:glycosyltransferase family 1 protein [Crocosphaera sp.]
MSQDEGKQLSPIFISLIPNLMEGEGHIIPYHKAVSQAVKQLGWQHKVIVPIDNKVDKLPGGWDENLSNNNLEKEGNLLIKFFRINESIKLAQTIANYFKREVINNSNPSIIFLERFIHLQLFALYLALSWVPTDNLCVWLLYRLDTHKDNTRWIYKLLNFLIKKRIKAGRFKLLTDSDRLSESLSNYFETPVTVMPIPHTDISHCSIKSQDISKIICWWPGSPREEKGWNIIKKLAHYSGDNTKKIRLICAETSQVISVNNGVDLILVQNYLSREEYYHWLGVSQIILLPYNYPAYEGRTSGIFTESIMAGKTPLVTEKTWMASELLKHNLSELVIDWEDTKQVFDIIEKVIKSDTIQDKIRKMQQRYQQFHNVDNYGCVLNKIYQEMML